MQLTPEMAARFTGLVTALCLSIGCADVETTQSEAPRGTLRLEVGSVRGSEVVGFAELPTVDTDELPRYELALRSSGRWERLGLTAVDAVLDPETRSLVWLDPAGSLWVAPLGSLDERRTIAGRVIPGMAASRGRVAFATRIDGPETAPFAIDLRTMERTTLDDAPGPDEILAWSPEGDEVLLLSGRTGLSSLFVSRLDGAPARQLTNIGLTPGRGLDPRRVDTAPTRARDVVWGRRGIAYRADQSTFVLEPGERPSRSLETGSELRELVR